MTLLDLITSSLRAIEVKNPGVTLTAEEVNDAKEVLNLMLDQWSAEGLPVYASTLEGLTLVVGASSRTIGTGGQFNTTRPTQILNAYIEDTGGISYPVEIIGANRYQGFSYKITAGRPQYLYYHGSAPLGIVYFYPTPDSADTIYLDSLKPLTAITVLTTTVSLPPGYEAALKHNLAVSLCPEYGREPSQILMKTAHDSKKAIEHINAASRLEPINLGFRRYPGASQTIYEG